MATISMIEGWRGLPLQQDASADLPALIARVRGLEYNYGIFSQTVVDSGAKGRAKTWKNLLARIDRLRKELPPSSDMWRGTPDFDDVCTSRTEVTSTDLEWAIRLLESDNDCQGPGTAGADKSLYPDWPKKLSASELKVYATQRWCHAAGRLKFINIVCLPMEPREIYERVLRLALKTRRPQVRREVPTLDARHTSREMLEQLQRDILREREDVQQMLALYEQHFQQFSALKQRIRSQASAAGAGQGHVADLDTGQQPSGPGYGARAHARHSLPVPACVDPFFGLPPQMSEIAPFACMYPRESELQELRDESCYSQLHSAQKPAPLVTAMTGVLTPETTIDRDISEGGCKTLGFQVASQDSGVPCRREVPENQPVAKRQPSPDIYDISD